MDMDKLLEATIKNGGSDLHLRVGAPPKLRVHGMLRTLGNQVLTPEDTVSLMKSITPERNLIELESEMGGSDFALEFKDGTRFRVSVFRHQNKTGVVLRQIPREMLSFETIGLPVIVKELCGKPRGLFLVTGPTGSGKTTTLASMINYINETRADHIVTIEDPIEYTHPHKKCVVSHREIGVDTPSFGEGLRRALRQDPDIILVGEMRDLETIEAAVTAAETGHLVFATLHTTGSAKTVNRIIDAFPTNQQEQIRTQLSVGLIAVLSQQLLRRADGKGRIAAFELMITTSSIQNLIRSNETFKIDSMIQTSAKMGMILLDDHLFNLYTEGLIKREDMLQRCVYPDQLMVKVRSWEAEREREQRARRR